MTAPRLPGLRMVRQESGEAVARAIAAREPVDTTVARGDCWLARREGDPERLLVQRFVPPERGGAGWPERWAAVAASLRAQAAAPSPFIGRVYGLERDDRGAWCAVSAWVDAYWTGHCAPDLGWRMQDALSALHDAARAAAHADALRAEVAAEVPEGLSALCPPIREGWRMTSSGALMTVGLDRASTSYRANARAWRVLEHAPEVERGARWSSAADVFRLGGLARRLLDAMTQAQRWPPPEDARRPALAELAGRCVAPEPEQRPSIGEVVATLGALGGPGPEHVGRLDASGALAWLRARFTARVDGPREVARLGCDDYARASLLGRACAMGVEPHQAAAVAAASSLFNLRPDLAREPALRDYVWHHLGEALLTPVRRGVVLQSSWRELMRWLPGALPELDRLACAPGARAVAQAEAVRLIFALGDDDPHTPARLARAQRDSPTRFAQQRAQTLARRAGAALAQDALPAPITADPDRPEACLGAWVRYRGQRWWVEVDQTLTLGSAPDVDVFNPAWPARWLALQVFPSGLVCTYRRFGTRSKIQGYYNSDTPWTFSEWNSPSLRVDASTREGCVWVTLSDVEQAPGRA